MSSETGNPGGRLAIRLLVFYIALAAISVVVVAVVVHAGQGEKAQPSIAGGYDAGAANACLGPTPKPVGGAQLPSTAPVQAAATGPKFNLLQSGQFVNITNDQGTLSGQLRLSTKTLAGGGHRLSGTVDCVSGGNQQKLDVIAVSGGKGGLAGMLGAVPLTASLSGIHRPPAPRTHARRAGSPVRTRCLPARPASVAR